MQFENDGSGGRVTPAGSRATRWGEHDCSGGTVTHTRRVGCDAIGRAAVHEHRARLCVIVEGKRSAIVNHRAEPSRWPNCVSNLFGSSRAGEFQPVKTF